MKRQILLISMLFVTMMSFSQISFGPKVGINLSRLSTDIGETISDIKEQSKSGFQIGAFVRIGNKTYIQPELLFSGRGGKQELTHEIGTDKLNYSIQTLDIPVLVGTKLINTPLAKIRIYAGPVASFVLSKTLSINEIEQIEEDIKLKNAIWAATFGAGVDVMMFTFDIRYELGLNDLNDGSAGINSIKNNMFNISLGWKIL